MPRYAPVKEAWPKDVKLLAKKSEMTITVLDHISAYFMFRSLSLIHRKFIAKSPNDKGIKNHHQSIALTKPIHNYSIHSYECRRGTKLSL